MSEASVKIRELVKTYVDTRGRPTFTAAKNISLNIEAGEFMVLVGPSAAENRPRSQWLQASKVCPVAQSRTQRSQQSDAFPKLCALSAHAHLREHGLRLKDREEEHFGPSFQPAVL